jgi:hypothetical protein
MSSNYLSDLIQLMEFDLNEFQAFQTQFIEQFQNEIQPSLSNFHPQKFTFPQVKLNEISVSLPIYPSIKIFASKQTALQPQPRLAIALPSSLIPISPNSLSRLNITFAVNETKSFCQITN